MMTGFDLLFLNFGRGSPQRVHGFETHSLGGARIGGLWRRGGQEEIHRLAGGIMYLVWIMEFVLFLVSFLTTGSL